MSEAWVERFVWDEAGLRFRSDGIYALDFGWESLVVTWDEVEQEPEQYLKQPQT